MRGLSTSSLCHGSVINDLKFYECGTERGVQIFLLFYASVVTVLYTVRMFYHKREDGINMIRLRNRPVCESDLRLVENTLSL